MSFLSACLQLALGILPLERDARALTFLISHRCAVVLIKGECPVGAITEGDGKYEIDPEKCISCGACEGVCPVGAPSEQA